jgi:hypothetical protein
MAALAAIREGLADNLAAISGLHASAYVRSKPPLPAAEVEPAGTTYDLAMGRGLDRFDMRVRVFVGLVSDNAAQKRLDLMLASTGATSVKTALETDRTLAGAASDLRVTSCSGYQIYGADGPSPVLGAEWTVEVLTSH